MKSFILKNTKPTKPSFVPEVTLYTATELTPLWQASEEFLSSNNLNPPYWAFAWPGGQAIARFILDYPEWVRGKRVLDFAAGNGMIGIAAMQAGALAVTAVEIDPMAVAAIELNTELNQVKLNAAVDNLIGQDLNGYDLVLAGDICYEKKMTDAVLSWLQPMVNLGKTVLLGDPGRTYLPSQGLHRHAQYTIPTTLELEAKNTLSTGVLQLLPSSSISG